MSDNDNEIIAELQDEIHGLEVSLNQIQREKFDLESTHKDLSKEHKEIVAKLKDTQETCSFQSEKIKELESDLLKTRAVLMINQKEFESKSCQTNESEFSKMQPPRKRPSVSIKAEDNKESPFNTNIPVSPEPIPQPMEEQELSNRSQLVSPVEFLNIIDLLKEENEILKKKIQLSQDIKYVKNRRSSLLQGGEIIL